MAAPLDLHRLAAAYVLDALDDDERRAFEAAYVHDPEVRDEVHELREAAASLATMAATPPPEHLRAAVLAEITATRQLSPRAQVRRDARSAGWRPLRFAAAAAAIVVVALAGWWFGWRAEPPGFAEQFERILAQRDSQVVSLRATTEGIEGEFRLVWSQAAGQVAVLADGLASPPSDQVYELWLIDAQGPAPMGLLAEGRQGSIRTVIELDGRPDAWGVTHEPVAGSPAPTGPILFATDV